MAEHWWHEPGELPPAPPAPSRLLRGFACAVFIEGVLLVGFELAWRLAHG